MGVTEILMSTIKNLNNDVLTSAAENANGVDNDNNTLKGNEISIFESYATALVKNGDVGELTIE